MNLSIVFPVFESTEDLDRWTRDLASFWSALPIEVEIILAADPNPAFSQEKLRSILANREKENLRFKVLTFARRQGRGKSLVQGLRQATGDVIAVNSIDLSIPLAEIFAGYTQFQAEPGSEFLLLGNRRGKKKKNEFRKAGARAFFENVEHEKAAVLKVEDPTSPFWMIRKSDWEDLKIESLPRWFSTPKVILAARKKGLSIRQIEIQSRDRSESHFRLRDWF